MESLSLPKEVDVILELETHFLLPSGPTQGLHLPVSLGLFHEGLSVQM